MALQMMLYHNENLLIGLEVEVVRGRAFSDFNLNMIESCFSMESGSANFIA